MPRRLLIGVCAYLVAGLLTLVLARTLAGAPEQLRLPLLVLGVGAVLPIALSRFPASRVLAVLFAVIFIATIAFIWHGALPERPYGDGGALARWSANGEVYPRWLLAMSLSTALYKGLWSLPPLAEHLPQQLKTPQAFTSMLCAVTMALGSLTILARWRGLAIIFAMLTPCWLLFSSGYREVYPLMIGAWLAALAWTFERPLEERHSQAIGFLVGLMPAVYIGLLGFSVLLWLAYAVRHPARAVPAMLWAGATLGVVIGINYGSIRSYLDLLYANMNFGGEHLSFSRYSFRAAGPHSIFFATKYAFASSHIADVAFMTFWSGGWLFVPVALGALVMMPAKNARMWMALRDVRFWLALALVCWQVYYLFYMIPLAGPTRDIDLFCPTFVLLAFVTGWLVHTGIEDERWRYAIVCALIGVDVVTAVFLAWIGVPSRI